MTVKQGVNLTGSWCEPILVLSLIYKRRDQMPITDPIFCPLLSTIITPSYAIRHATTGMRDWDDRNIIWHTYTLFIDSSNTIVAPFILHKLTHVPLYRLINGIA
jgi:hypothetical protein